MMILTKIRNNKLLRKLFLKSNSDKSNSRKNNRIGRIEMNKLLKLRVIRIQCHWFRYQHLLGI